MPVDVLELFAGIGGLAFALGSRGRTVLAVDQDAHARATYARQHPGTPRSPFNLHAASIDWFAPYARALWWMSPPCQPYTIRGQQRDLADRRSQAFQRVCAAIAAHQPLAVGFENVPWFAGSQGEDLLLSTLDQAGYHTYQQILCPTALGIAAERRRYYLVACRRPLPAPPPPAPPPWTPVQRFLDPAAAHDPTLQVEPELLDRYAHALHVVDADDSEASFACFTGAYGRSPVHAGSYLRQDGRIRRLSPHEIAATLGHPRFDPPPDLRPERRYKLVGNSLSVPAVQHMLARLPLDDLIDERPAPGPGPGPASH